MVTARADRIREARVARGLSQLELADRAGVRQATISNVERGQSCRPSTLRQISLALGIPLSEVIAWPTVSS